MIFTRFAVTAFALFLGITYPGTARAYSLPAGSPQYAHGQDRGDWDAPPQELREMQRRGFRDGIIGAQKDFDNHRRPDPNNRDEYRRPNNVPYDMVEAYRDGFRRGYERVTEELQGYFGRHY
jgi:hypothetical protein